MMNPNIQAALLGSQFYWEAINNGLLVTEGGNSLDYYKNVTAIQLIHKKTHTVLYKIDIPENAVPVFFRRWHKAITSMGVQGVRGLKFVLGWDIGTKKYRSSFDLMTGKIVR